MKNRNSIQRTALALALVSLLAGTVATAADSYTKTLTAYYSGIKLVVDGVAVTPKDANGNKVEPFIVDGTTYLPVRAVAEALGKDVSWDGKTRTVYLGEPVESTAEDNSANAERDAARRAALLAVLERENDGSLKYAKLIDVDGDGTEDLLLLKETVEDGFGNKFHSTAYSYDGAEVRTINLSRPFTAMVRHNAGNEPSPFELTPNRYYSSERIALCRENETDELYVEYSGEIVGGWGGTVMVSASNALFFEYPYLNGPLDEFPADVCAAYDEQLREYEENMARYTEIERIDASSDGVLATISRVRDSLR